MFQLRPKWYPMLVAVFLINSVNGFGAKLSMNLQQSGFHRTIKYITVFTEPPEKPCDFHLKQVIPSSAYVSLDQLDDLNRFDKIDYYTEAVVDVERITSKSNQFNIYLYGDTASLFVIQLPLHLRYHSPAYSSFVKVNIDYPQPWPKYRQMVNPSISRLDGALSRVTKPLLYVDCHGQRTVNATHDREIVDLKCRKTNERCKWINIDYEIHSEPITLNVPIGQRNFGGIVTAVTIFVSWIGSYYIARALMRKSTALKKRL